MWECRYCGGLIPPYYTECPICHTPKVGIEKVYKIKYKKEERKKQEVKQDIKVENGEIAQGELE